MLSNSVRHFWNGLGKIAAHAGITLLALGIAFSLPHAASYILFNWWPKVRDDARMMVLTEIAFAAVLVLLLNFGKSALRYRKAAHAGTLASLVCAREPAGKEADRGSLLRSLPWKRDLTVMAVTGYSSFAAPDSSLKSRLDQCYEIRVMLLDPYGEAAASYAASQPDSDAVLAAMRREVRASVACLRSLQAAGKKVSLKFYDDRPFWKLLFTGEHVWVRSCHGSRDGDGHAEFVFALHPEKPGRGFFPSFYTYFLNQWNDPRHPDYAFDTEELVYQDARNGKLRRIAYPDAEDPPTDSS
jgi:hypothetical protein